MTAASVAALADPLRLGVGAGLRRRRFALGALLPLNRLVLRDLDADLGLLHRHLLIGFRLRLLERDPLLLGGPLRVVHRLFLFGEVSLLRGVHERFGKNDVADHHRDHFHFVLRHVLAHGFFGIALLRGTVLLIVERRDLRDLRAEDAVDLGMDDVLEIIVVAAGLVF